MCKITGVPCKVSFHLNWKWRKQKRQTKSTLHQNSHRCCIWVNLGLKMLPFELDMLLFLELMMAKVAKEKSTSLNPHIWTAHSVPRWCWHRAQWQCYGGYVICFTSVFFKLSTDWTMFGSCLDFHHNWLCQKLINTCDYSLTQKCQWVIPDVCPLMTKARS